MKTEIMEEDLMNHFKEFNNVCTDYPTMLEYLLPEYGDGRKLGNFFENHNLIYHKLTHEIVPRLEKKKILKRCKLFDGTWVFIINKRRLMID